MTSNPDTPIGELAEEYLSALENGVVREKLEEAKEEALELRERHDRFVEKYGESDPATNKLSDRLTSAEDRIDRLEEEQELPKELEKAFLERATTFMLTDEWLQTRVIEAFNRALIGERDATLVIEEVEIEGEADVADLDELTRFDLIDVVRQLALDKLGEPSDIRECWETLEGTTKEEPFRIVAAAGGANPDEVLEQLEEDDVNRETVRGRLKNATQKDVNPYVRRDGMYHLSTVGKYISNEYANVDSSSVKKEPEDGDNGDEQVTFGQTSAADGGDSND